MCISTRQIFNPVKTISRHYWDRLILDVPCGRCCECDQRKGNEWYYRASVEWHDCIKRGGFVLMDGLSYSEDTLPHFSDFLSAEEREDFPSELDFPCFSHRDIRLYRESLSNKLKRAGYDVNSENFRFFLSSEYGTSDEYIDDHGRVRVGTHRPHYHILYYCSVPGLSNLELSRFISETWTKGRTDGVFYKGVRYVNEEKTFRAGNAASIAVSRYVTKYVQKDCEFRSQIDRRISALMMYFAEKNHCFFEPVDYYDPEFYCDVFGGQKRLAYVNDERRDFLLERVDYLAVDSWLRSENGKKMRRDIVRMCDQFHRQSTGFGASIIPDLDIDNIMENGTINVLDKQKVVLIIPLPLYYKRKLFYKQVTIDGVRTWQPTERGLLYIQKRMIKTAQLVAARYRAASVESGLHTDCNFDSLADYMVYRRGRFRGWILSSSTPEVRSKWHDNFYSYTTSSDAKYFHQRFVTDTNLGNSTAGYLHNVTVTSAGSRKFAYKDVPIRRIPLERFLNEHVYKDAYFDGVIDDLQKVMYDHAIQRQKAYEEKQRLEKLYRNFH